MKDLIAAIDLGTTKVVVAVGEKTPNGVKVVGYAEVASKGVKRGRVENIKLANQALKKALEKIQEQIGVKISAALVGIAGQDIKCITPEPWQIQRKDFDELITQSEINEITALTYNLALEDGYKVFHSIPQAYNVDNYMSVSEPVGMIGKNIVAKFKVFAGKENSQRIIQNTLKLSGINVQEIVLEPVASAESVLTDDEKEVGCVLVDIGGGTTDVIVMHHNIIRYAAIIPFGGKSVTEDISTGCGIAWDRAEYIKVNHGCCFSDYAEANKKIMLQGVGGTNNKEIQIKVLAKIIQARMEEIFEAVMWHIEQSGFKDVLRGGIVLTGGGSQIKNIVNLASFVTGYEARIAAPNAYSIDPKSVMEAKKATASTAVGMLIHAFNKMENDGVSYLGGVNNITLSQETELLENSANELETVGVDNSTNDGTAAPKATKKGFGWWGALKKGGKKIKDGLTPDGLFSADNTV